MKKCCKLMLLMLALASGALADHKNGTTWSWHVLSAGLDESRVAIYDKKALVGIFDFSCDLTSDGEGDMRETDASLELVQPSSNPEGLLVVTCNVGAHSQYLAIVDPTRKTNQPVFAETGSYFAKWELQDGELWISYDYPCDTGMSVECPDGFETVFVQYPAPQ